MPKKIDHEQRKELILKKSLEVFAKNGYKATTLSLIAKECNFARTTTYEYFKSIDEILWYAVKITTGRMLEKYSSPEWNDLTKIVDDVIETADNHIAEILNLIRSLDITGLNLHEEIHHRTAKLRLFLCRLVRKKKNEGYYININSEHLVDKLFSMIEAYCFELAFFGRQEADHIKSVIHTGLRACQNLQCRTCFEKPVH